MFLFVRFPFCRYWRKLTRVLHHHRIYNVIHHFLPQMHRHILKYFEFFFLNVSFWTTSRIIDQHPVLQFHESVVDCSRLHLVFQKVMDGWLLILLYFALLYRKLPHGYLLARLEAFELALLNLRLNQHVIVHVQGLPHRFVCIKDGG